MPSPGESSAHESVAGRGARARQAVATLRRRAWIVATCVLLLPALAYVAVASEAKQRQASVVLEPQPLLPANLIVSSAVPRSWFGASTASFVALLAQTPQVTSGAANIVHRAGATLGRVTARADEKTGWTTVSVTAPSARAAIAGATAVSIAVDRNLQARSRQAIRILVNGVQQQLARTHDAGKRRELTRQMRALTSFNPEQQQTVQVIQPAVDAREVSNEPGIAAAAVFVLSLLMAAWLVKLVERADPRIHDPAVVESLTATPLLAALPRDESASAAAFVRLRDAVVYLRGQRSRTTIAVTSAMRDDGRTTVALGLAVAFAADGRSVLLVDADLRDPAIAARADVPAHPGLADVLRGEDLKHALRRREGAWLAVLPAGAVDRASADLMASERSLSVLDQLAERFDVVVIDTPPLLAASDALAFASHVSGVVLVARIDHTRGRSLQRAVQLLKGVGANLLGPVAVGTVGEDTMPRGRQLPFPPLSRQPALTTVGAGEPDAKP